MCRAFFYVLMLKIISHCPSVDVICDTVCEGNDREE